MTSVSREGICGAMSELETQIRTALRRVAVGDESPSVFATWFTPLIATDIEQSDPTAAHLIYQVELWLSEADRGHRSSDDLRALFRSLTSEPPSWISISARVGGPTDSQVPQVRTRASNSVHEPLAVAIA